MKKIKILLKETASTDHLEAYLGLANFFKTNPSYTQITDSSNPVIDWVKIIQSNWYHTQYGFEPLSDRVTVDNRDGRVAPNLPREILSGANAARAVYWGAWELMTSNRKVFKDQLEGGANYNPFDVDNEGIRNWEKKYGREAVHTLLDIIGVADPFGVADGLNCFLYYEDWQKFSDEIKTEHKNFPIAPTAMGAEKSPEEIAWEKEAKANLDRVEQLEKEKTGALINGVASLLSAVLPYVGDFSKLSRAAKDWLVEKIGKFLASSKFSMGMKSYFEAMLEKLGVRTAKKISTRITINLLPRETVTYLFKRMFLNRLNKSEYLTVTFIQSIFLFASYTDGGSELIQAILNLPFDFLRKFIGVLFSQDDIQAAIIELEKHAKEDPEGKSALTMIREKFSKTLDEAHQLSGKKQYDPKTFFKELILPNEDICKAIADIYNNRYGVNYFSENLGRNHPVTQWLAKFSDYQFEKPGNKQGKKPMKEEIKKINFKNLKLLIEQILNEKLILEGGAGGHMRHPFDIKGVTTGEDLKNKFIEIGNFIKSGAKPDTKIDGVNASIKVIDGPNGKEFAMDRGSLTNSIDISGITINKLEDRFEPGHGMITIGKTVLAIFNDALSDIEPELKELGMLDDPSKFFNMEYVKGTTNVLAYNHDFLKIHGVNQFYNKKDKLGNLTRPGIDRPLDNKGKPLTKDPSTPITYDKEVLDNLVQKLNKHAEKFGFKVYSSIGSKAVGDFDFNSVLNVPVPVTLSKDNVDEQTLEKRLKNAINRINEKVELADGRVVPAQGKEIYKAVLGARAEDKNVDPSRETPLDLLLSPKEDRQKAIDGAVFWHATRLFGDVIIDNMEVDHPAVHGPAKDHEGLVIRLPGDTFDIKITGEFILGGEASTFRSDSSEVKGKGKTIGIFPGSFKPPHKGHLSVIKGILQNSEIDEVKVIISAPTKEVRSPKITPEKAKEVFEKYISASSFSKPVSVEVASKPSPIQAAYDYIENTAQPNETIILLTSQADASRYPQSMLDKAAAASKNASSITVKSQILPACRDESCDTADKISATTIRKIIDSFPNITIEDIKRATKLMPDEMSTSDKLSVFELLVGEPLSNKFSKEELENLGSLEEASVAGSVAGLAGSIGKKEEERTIYNMRENLSLEESILKNYLVENYVKKFKSLLKEVDAATATGMTYVTDAFSTTKSNFEKRFGGLGEQDQRISFLINFLNKMVHGFIQQDVGEGIPPVMPFDELVEKGILTFEISKAGQEFAQSALEEGEMNEQEDVKLNVGGKPEEEKPEDNIEGIVPDEEADTEAEKEKEQQDKMKAGQISPEVTEEPIGKTNETGNRAALAYYKLDSKNIFRFYNLIGPEDTADREQFIEFYFKNIIALAAGIERSKSGNLPEPLNTMFNKLSTGSDVVKEPQLEAPPAEAPAAPAPETAPTAPLQEGDISRIIKNSVINTFRRLQYR